MLDELSKELDAAEVRKRQAKEAKEAKGPQPRVVCSCGEAKPLRHLYKCLYCDCFFCKPCAEVHFGKTVEQHKRETAA